MFPGAQPLQAIVADALPPLVDDMDRAIKFRSDFDTVFPCSLPW
jgi:hypothetical protein